MAWYIIFFVLFQQYALQLHMQANTNVEDVTAVKAVALSTIGTATVTIAVTMDVVATVAANIVGLVQVVTVIAAKVIGLKEGLGKSTIITVLDPKEFRMILPPAALKTFIIITTRRAMTSQRAPSSRPLKAATAASAAAKRPLSTTITTPHQNLTPSLHLVLAVLDVADVADRQNLLIRHQRISPSPFLSPFSKAAAAAAVTPTTFLSS